LKKYEEGEKETSCDHSHMNCLLIFLFFSYLSLVCFIETLFALLLWYFLRLRMHHLVILQYPKLLWGRTNTAMTIKILPLPLNYFVSKIWFIC